MKPMLAEDVVSFESLRYPLYGSYKVDGVRALMTDDGFQPRSLKRFANVEVSNVFEASAGLLRGMEGELTLGGNPAATDVRLCSVTTSVTSTLNDARARDLHWWVFDLLPQGPHPTVPFRDRITMLKQRFNDVRRLKLKNVHLLEQRLIRSPAEADAFESEAIARGYEGIVLKDPDGVYKFGRSTLRSQQFLRVKRFTDAEGKIVGFVERQKNNNEATTNELGHKTRSSHKANKAGSGTLGTLKVEMINGQFAGKIIEVGTGWDAVTGQWIWDHKAEVMDLITKVKYFGHGCKDLPRFATYEGFRDQVDMS